MSSVTTATVPSTPSTSAFDGRLVEMDIVLPDHTYTFDQNYMIQASGIKFANANANTCECRIYNLTKKIRDTILTLASPLLFPPSNNAAASLPKPRPPVILNLRAGRVSTGTFLLFTGNVITCEMTQPPDIGITFRSLTNNYNNSLLLGLGLPGVTDLESAASTIAAQMGLYLDFEATNKNINNFVLDPVLGKNVDKLNQMGGIRAGVDNMTLWVTNTNSPRKNTGFTISEATGMVGIPQVTDQGVTVRVMLNSAIYIGGQVTINSAINPAANGTFVVAKMDYEIASRDQPFWATLLCSASPIYLGDVG